jgi:pimeloyl-ACP methyl ester carboxylesterase
VTKVDYKNPARAPMLFVTGSEDHISPPSINKANLKRQQRARSATEYKEYLGRAHFIAGENGWEEVADYTLSWAAEHAEA